MPNMLDELLEQSSRTREAFIRQMQQDWAERDKLRDQLLSDPEKLSKAATGIVAPFMPKEYKKKKTGESPLQAYERVTPSGHPMKGAPAAIRDEFATLLAAPENRYSKIDDVAAQARENVLSQPAGKYKTRLEGLYKETRLEKAELFGDETKTPPGYEDWVTEVRRQEDIEAKKQGLYSGGEFILGTLAGGLVGGVIGAFGGPPGAVAGAIAGAKVGAATEVIAQPIRRKVIHQTEWYKSKQMEGTGAWETIKSTGPEMLLEGGIDAALTKSLLKQAPKLATRVPAAKELLQIEYTGKAFDKDIAKVLREVANTGEPLSDKAQDTVMTTALRLSRNSPELLENVERALTVRPSTAVKKAANIVPVGEQRKVVKATMKLLPYFGDDEIDQVVDQASRGMKMLDAIDNTAKHKQNIIDATKIEESGYRLLDTYANAISKVNEVSTETFEKVKINYGKNIVEYTPVKAFKFDDETYMLGVTSAGKEGWFVAESAAEGGIEGAATKVVSEKQLERLKYGLDPKNITPEDIWTEGLDALAKGIQPEQLGYKIPASKEVFNLSLDPNTTFPLKDIWEGSTWFNDLKSWYADEGLATFTDDGLMKITPEGLKTIGKSVDDAIEVALPENITDDVVESIVRNSDKPTEVIKELEDYADAIEFFGETTVESIIKEEGLTQRHLDIMQEIADSIAAKKLERAQLASEGLAQGPIETIDEFLARGGKITTDVPNNAVKKNNVRLRKKGVMIAGVIPAAAIGYLTFSPEEAQAGVTTTVAKSVASMIKGDLKANLTQLRKAGLAAKAVTTEKRILKEHLMTEAINFAEQGKTAYGETWNNIIKRTKSLPMNLQRFMSPYAQGAYWYKSWANPGVDLGYRLTASKHNMKQQFTVFSNIISDYKALKPVTSEVARATEPLAARYSGDVTAYQVLSSAANKMEKSLEKLRTTLEKRPEIKNKIGRKIASKERDLKRVNSEIKKLQPVWDSFSNDWESTMKDLAAKHPSVRVALAAEDSILFDKYPWLKPMVESSPLEERQVIAGIKNMMNDYKVRLKAGKHSVVEDGYIHHAWHPKWDETQAEKILNQFKDLSEFKSPLGKFHQRNLYSKQMMPDIYHIMARYIPDTEKRIQMNEFWKGWSAPRRQAQYIDGLDRYWKSIEDTVGVDEDMLKPGARIANLYTSFEVMRLLSLMPSVAFKHLFKLEGTAASLGAMSVARRAPTSLKRTFKHYLRREGIVPELLRRSGVAGKVTNTIEDEVIDSYIQLDRYTQALNNMGYSPQYRPANGMFDKVMLGVEKALDRANHEGSVLVGLVEGFDRVDGMMAALDMAANKGRTVNQAAYMMIDTLAKNSFYGGWLNSKWMKNPYFRSMLMFQNTPFKLLERRVNNAIGAMETLGKVLPPGGIHEKVAKLVKKEGWEYVGKRLKELKQSMFNAEGLSKQAMLYDFLTADKDVFGTQSLKVFGRELVYSSLVFGGFSMAGMDVLPHTFHLPFISHKPGAEPAELGYSPIITGAIRSMSASSEYLEDREVGRLGYFFRQWLGSGGVAPRFVYKTMKLSNDDIPEIYRNSAFSYLFSVPRTEKD